MARYIPETYSNRLSAQLQQQANDLIPKLEKAASPEECFSLVQQFGARTKATAYIQSEDGTILYTTDELDTSLDQDSVATTQEHQDSRIFQDAPLLSQAGYVFTLLGSDYTLYLQSDTLAINQSTEAIWNTVPLILLGTIIISIPLSLAYSHHITKPIIALSHASQKTAQLDFQAGEHSHRCDEIGILSQNLNALSENLQLTLSQLEKSNRELEAEMAKERQLEQKQREFFSAASHELKTPLTILKGHLTGMLHHVKGYENREMYMERSLAVVDKMETLVKELLYLSKTSKKETHRYQKIDFSKLLRLQIAELADLLSEKDLNLVAEIPDKLFCQVEPMQMAQALQNILTNAIRYSPKGESIHISLSAEQDTVSCQVENTGVHIPEEMLPHLFEAFYRADTSRNRNTGETGLGLYIVGNILKSHQATYGIQNSYSGVLFWFTTPQKADTASSI